MIVITNKDIERDELNNYANTPGIYTIMLKPTESTLHSYIKFMERRHVDRNFTAYDSLNQREFQISISPSKDEMSNLENVDIFSTYSRMIDNIVEPLYIGMTGNLKERIETHLSQFKRIVSILNSVDLMGEITELDFTEEIESDMQKINDKANSFAKRLATVISEHYKEFGTSPSVTSLWFKVVPLENYSLKNISEIESLLIRTIRPMGNIKI